MIFRPNQDLRHVRFSRHWYECIPPWLVAVLIFAVLILTNWLEAK
jgi:hypothetical protein